MRVKEPLKVAIIGCGRIGQMQHIPSVLRIRRAQLAAICDQNEALVIETARRFDINRYYTDFSEMLAREDVDILDICTPPQTHLDLSIRAMEAGCHILVEKPMVFSLREVNDIANAAKRNDVKVCEIHNKLFEPVMIKACTLVSEGGIGDLTGIDVQMLQSQAIANFILMNREHWCHSLPAGIFTETLPHPIYLAAAFAGKLEPIATYTGKSSGYDWVAADEIRVIWKANKCMGTISYSCNSPKSKTIIDIHGTRKHLRIDLLNSVMTEYGIGIGTRPSRALENLSQSFSILASTISTTLSVISGKFHSGHYTLIERFIESIQDDSEPPVTLQETRDVMEVLERVTAQIKSI